MSENREISKNMNKSAADQDLAWEEVSVEHIVQDKWIDFRRAAYRFPDGTTFSPYYNSKSTTVASVALIRSFGAILICTPRWPPLPMIP